ncbi:MULTISPECIES: hypothetical protein [Aquitalea]|uniref:hypothetical protein n=1 Tax=Aquitalea TaxID=407217 RepID=UPI000F5A65DB|nr:MULTISPECIES: hypothetical protein [Aquitalea]
MATPTVACVFSKNTAISLWKNFSDKIGSKVKLGWVRMRGVNGRVVFSIEADGVAVESYDSTILKYEVRRQKARDSTANYAIFIIFAIVIGLILLYLSGVDDNINK